MEKITSQLLPVKLTDEEIKDRAHRAALGFQKMTRLEEDKKAAVSSYAAQIKATQLEVTELNRAVVSGVDYRQVDCDQTVDMVSKKVHIYRNDTLEHVMSRPLTDHEYREEAQPVLDNLTEQQEFVDKVVIPIKKTRSK